MTLPNQEASGGQNLYLPLLFLKGKKQRGQGEATRAHLAAAAAAKEVEEGELQQ